MSLRSGLLLKDVLTVTRDAFRPETRARLLNSAKEKTSAALDR